MLTPCWVLDGKLNPVQVLANLNCPMLLIGAHSVEEHVPIFVACACCGLVPLGMVAVTALEPFWLYN